MTDIEKEAIAAALKTRDRSNSYIQGNHTNPYTVGRPIYNSKTGLFLGNIKETNPEMWDMVHWALIDVPKDTPPLVALSFQMGMDFTCYPPPIIVSPPPPFHIGQRKFQKNYTAPFEMRFIGVIADVWLARSGAEWVCATDKGVQSFPREFAQGSMFIGQREHRGKTLAQLRATESTSE